jgi:hypothetical protein
VFWSCSVEHTSHTDTHNDTRAEWANSFCSKHTPHTVHMTNCNPTIRIHKPLSKHIHTPYTTTYKYWYFNTGYTQKMPLETLGKYKYARIMYTYVKGSDIFTWRCMLEFSSHLSTGWYVSAWSAHSGSTFNWKPEALFFLQFDTIGWRETWFRYFSLLIHIFCNASLCS